MLQAAPILHTPFAYASTRRPPRANQRPVHTQPLLPPRVDPRPNERCPCLWMRQNRTSAWMCVLDPNVRSFREFIRNQCLVLPMLALLDLLHKFGAHQLGAATNGTLCLGAAIEPLHQMVGSSRNGVFKRAFERRGSDDRAELLQAGSAAVEHWDGC